MITADKIRAKDFTINLSDVWQERHEIELEKIEQYVLGWLYEYPETKELRIPVDTSFVVCEKLRILGYTVTVKNDHFDRTVLLSW